MSGTGSNNFSPDAVITKQDLCVALYKLYKDRLGIPIYTYNSKVTFSDDADISSYAKTAVYALQQMGVISGSGGAFNPKSNVTRAIAASMFYEMWDYGFILSTPQQLQLKTNWCWAASAYIMAEYRYEGSKTQTQIANYINGGKDTVQTNADIAEGSTWATYNNIQHDYNGILNCSTIINYISNYKPTTVCNGYYDSSGKWYGHFMVCIGFVKNPTNINQSKLFIYNVGNDSYYWVTYSDYLNGTDTRSQFSGKTYVGSAYSL